ncbi:hypothetical protein GCM10010191_41390 [Actinomadura vinacea]|uniref:Uncharacterized protein n=1 Tax=Actinomadura vinacea TaxID=115336 RepID=A0ABN3J912_9ACTN
MRTRRIRATTYASTLERLHVSDAEPDPGFRAGLRARLVAAADALDRGDDSRNSGRRQGSAKPGD